jgi:hypothetical protein
MEIARRNGSLARLDLRQIVQTIPVKGMATGGYASSYSPPVLGGVAEGRGGSGTFPTDTAILQKFDELADVIKQIKIYTAIEDIQKADKKFTEIQNTRGL